MTKVHTVDYRVYYEDTDAGGIMYHSNFINFCERGRSELLRDIGFPASSLIKTLNMGFVVRHLEADFMKIAQLDDLLTVHTYMKEIKNTSFVLEQVITCQNSTAFKMDVTLVCLDVKGKPMRMPEELRNKFNDYLEES